MKKPATAPNASPSKAPKMKVPMSIDALSVSSSVSETIECVWQRGCDSGDQINQRRQLARCGTSAFSHHLPQVTSRGLQRKFTPRKQVADVRGTWPIEVQIAGCGLEDVAAEVQSGNGHNELSSKHGLNLQPLTCADTYQPRATRSPALLQWPGQKLLPRSSPAIQRQPPAPDFWRADVSRRTQA